MENTLLIVIIALIAFLAILVALIAYFGVRFFKMKEKEQELKTLFKKNTVPSLSSINPEAIKEFKKHQKDPSKFQAAKECDNHPDRYAHHQCAISSSPLCQDCLVQHDGHWIGRSFFEFYLADNWLQIKLFSENENDQIQYISQIKNQLWEDEIPLIIQGHYKINVENDNIESFTAIYCRESDENEIKSKLGMLH